ncbi:hypothetical protein AAHE18_03G147500 [Arachis hypogaea]
MALNAARNRDSISATNSSVNPTRLTSKYIPTSLCWYSHSAYLFHSSLGSFSNAVFFLNPFAVGIAAAALSLVTRDTSRAVDTMLRARSEPSFGRLKNAANSYPFGMGWSMPENGSNFGA